ncbi:MAG: DMT family transporter [Anaerovoracaceae bacterium]
MTEKRKVHLILIVLVLSWGLEYVLVKTALGSFQPLTLVFFKYSIGAIVLTLIVLKVDKKFVLHKRDILLFLLCAIFGEVLYFWAEYTAMDYMPISLITIMLALVPIFSIGIERVLHKRKTNFKVIIGVIVCVVGMSLIIGVDFEMILQGRFIGYLLCLLAVFSWNVYLFITDAMVDRYSSFQMTFYQVVCSILLVLPYALGHMPNFSTFTAADVGVLLYLGVISTGIGFSISVYGIRVLGPTPMAVYANFLPVTATFFAWIILGEKISTIQFIGGATVIIAAFIVIREKGKLDERYNLEQSQLKGE